MPSWETPKPPPPTSLLEGLTLGLFLLGTPRAHLGDMPGCAVGFWLETGLGRGLLVEVEVPVRPPRAPSPPCPVL